MNAKQIEIRKQMSRAQDAYNQAYESGNSRGRRRAERTLDRLAAKLHSA